MVMWALRSAGVEEWLVRLVMAMYAGTKTRVKCGVGHSDWFEIKVGVHQGSILSPLLFIIVLEETTKSFRVGLPGELLYADDVAMAAKSEEELKDKLRMWVTGLEQKGLKVNAGKTKIMVCRWKRSLNQGRRVKWPCGVCNEGVGANSILCQKCEKWIHRRCSGGRGNLVAFATNFECPKCRGVSQEQDCRNEVFELDGVRYDVANNFCYLGDVLDGSGGCVVAVNRRLKAGWAKFKELAGVVMAKDIPNHLKGLVYKTCIRPVAIYGSETWPLKVEEERRLQRMERKMLRWMVCEDVEEDEARKKLKVEDDVAVVMRRNRLRWFGHVERRQDSSWLRKVRELEVGGSRPKGRPQQSWSRVIDRDLREWRMKKDDTRDREKWRKTVQASGRVTT